MGKAMFVAVLLCAGLMFWQASESVRLGVRALGHHSQQVAKADEAPAIR